MAMTRQGIAYLLQNGSMLLTIRCGETILEDVGEYPLPVLICARNTMRCDFFVFQTIVLDEN